MVDITWFELISQYGFPIFCCIVMGWYVYKTNKEHREEIKELNAMHKEEVEKITSNYADQTKEIVTAVQNNTIAVRELTAKLDAKAVNS